MSARRCVIVMAKDPRAGGSKTRLAASAGLTAAQTADLAEAFVHDTLRTAQQVADAEVWVCHAPPDSAARFAAWAPRARILAQVAGDLGARMRAAFAAAFESGPARVVMIGSDTPHLPAERIEAAFARLDAARVVLGPATDGGYYLVGLDAPAPALFEGIAWSTPDVLAETRERARNGGLELALLDELRDVDDAADLAELARSIRPDGEPCPRTARALAGLGRLPRAAT